jgi:hypothetical protein
MTTVHQLAPVLERVFGTFAEEKARAVGFVRRRSKLDGIAFARTMVFGWLGSPDASLSGLAQMAATVGVKISNQGLDQRFGQKAADFMKEILSAVVAEVVAASQVDIPLLQRFSAVVLQDSSTVILPNDLSTVWRGNGSRTGDGEAALKIQVQLDLSNGALTGPLMENGRSQDRNSPIQSVPLPRGALRIADLGYFSLDGLRNLEVEGDFYLSRLQANTAVFDEQGNRLNLVDELRKAGSGCKVDIPVQLGVKHRLRARLLAVSVPEEVANARRRRLRRGATVRGQGVSKQALAMADWTILVTNVPQEKLSVDEALILARARWQVELLFKLWKWYGRIDEWRSENPWRILCETYAKLTAVVIQHWLMVTSIWAYPDRSLVKAAQTIRAYAVMLASGIAGAIELVVALEEIQRCLGCGCRMNKRKRKPNTHQLLEGVAYAA